jgi:predicted phosphodiesterase
MPAPGRAGSVRVVRVAALYDIHGNLPALEAVLAEVERERVDAIVLGGDVVAGPFPHETYAAVAALGERALALRGNVERAMLEIARGEREPREGAAGDPWVVAAFGPDELEALGSLPEQLRLDVDGLGPVRFVHATVRDDEELFTEETPDAVVAEMFAGADTRVVVCGHTHMQVDRTVGDVRIVNAGSVGMPYEAQPGAYWAVLGPDVELRRTEYDLTAAAAQVAQLDWPRAEEFVRENLLTVPTRAEAIDVLERQAGRRGA